MLFVHAELLDDMFRMESVSSTFEQLGGITIAADALMAADENLQRPAISMLYYMATKGNSQRIAILQSGAIPALVEFAKGNNCKLDALARTALQPLNRCQEVRRKIEGCSFCLP